MAQRNKNWGYAQVLVLAICQASMFDPRNLSHTGRAFPPRRNAHWKHPHFFQRCCNPRQKAPTPFSCDSPMDSPFKVLQSLKRAFGYMKFPSLSKLSWAQSPPFPSTGHASPGPPPFSWRRPRLPRKRRRRRCLSAWPGRRRRKRRSRRSGRGEAAGGGRGVC